MNILYHYTNPPPRILDTEASLQEINWLRNSFGGKLVYLNPNQNLPIRLHRLFFGFHKLRQIWAMEENFQAHHLYHFELFPFIFLRCLRRPTIYSISSGIGRRRPNMGFFASLAAVTVSDQRSLNLLRAWGLNNSFIVQPGIDITRFTPHPLPLRSEIRLMVGSAPWTHEQFSSKGTDALLAAVHRAPYLHLVCLWRGVLAEEMESRVRCMNLEKQVEILNKKVDVNQVLAKVHASIAVVTDPAIIRPYPHSLIESLVAGKPIIVSRSIAMSDYVEQNGCGKIVETVDPADILNAVEELANEYEVLQKSTEQLGQRDFSQQRLITSFQKVYEQVCGAI